MDWDLDQFKWILTELEKLKANAGRCKGGDSSAVLSVDGLRFLVHRTGVKHVGGEDGGVFFEFNIEGDGVQYHIGRRAVAHGVQPNVYVKVGSCPLMEHGHNRMWWKAVGVLKCLGATIERAVLSRIDLCVDLPGQDVAPFVRAMERGQVIRKALKWRPYYYGVDGTTGFECGSELKLRAYDKLQETEHDPIKRELLKRLRWGGVIPEKATRVEYRVTRNMMRERSVGDIDDAFSKLPAIAEFLTHDWFRMVRGFDRANRHHDRATIHKLWRKVTEAMEWTGQGGGELVRREARPDPEKLLLAVFGNLSSAAALEGRVLNDREMLTAYLADKIQGLDLKRFAEAQERKFVKLEARYPGLAAADEAPPF